MKNIVKNIVAAMGYEIRPVKVESDPLWKIRKVIREHDLGVLECLEEEDVRKLFPPLFPSPAVVPADIPLKHFESIPDMVHSQSMKLYFDSVGQGANISITDDNPDNQRLQYNQRIPLLASVYQKYFNSDLSGLSVLDVGCSAGYQSFVCGRAGASSVTGIDMRPEHGE